ncbi:Pyridine nucleotide-disulfide oxidoreductase dimerization [Penicillium sp. DV-2018c]|nr:Pyridine nucleotide-disulfide oxidoreductase dimerization [Penicillium sp. DV-2018c]KAJ5559327.1 Pyridine nucleotide-disulfide oxidoreductase dimerization [Penicillium sp. DV-2018c]
MSQQEYKLKDIASFASLSSDKVEAEVEGIEDGKVLLVKLGDKVHAMNPRCSHYGAPLKNGVVTADGRITCPWHGGQLPITYYADDLGKNKKLTTNMSTACFNVTTGDVEDAPAPNALNKFEVFEKNGGVYIHAREEDIKAGQRNPVFNCKVSKADEKVVVVGGGSGTLGLVQALREQKYPGAITVISREPYLIIDRTKLSKALIDDPSKIEWRPREWYAEAAIETITDEVTAVDFNQKTVSTKSGKSFAYTKLVLATGGIPRSLPLPGFKGDLGNVFTLRTITDVQAILSAAGSEKRNIVIIGSSFIGMEVGLALSKNHNVRIVGMESAPMERVMGAQVGRIFRSNLEKSGVTFHLDANVSHATASPSDANKVGTVHLKDGTALPADLVIQGVGVRPATDFLRDNSAVTLEKDGSLRTDAHFLVPGLQDSVFAIGDIATYPYFGPGSDAGGTPVRIEHWNVAQNAGRTAARAIVHTQRGPLSSLKPKHFIPVFWSALGAQLRYCGNPVHGFDDVIVREQGEAKFVAFYTAGETVVAVSTMGVDPVMSKSAELMRAGKMPSKKEVLGGVDILSVPL